MKLGGSSKLIEKQKKYYGGPFLRLLRKRVKLATSKVNAL